MIKKSLILTAMAFLFATSIASSAATLTYSGVVTESIDSFGLLLPPDTAVTGSITVEDAALASGLIESDDITEALIQVSGFCFAYQAFDCLGIEIPIVSFDSVAITGTSDILGGDFSITSFSSGFQLLFPMSFDLDAGTFSLEGGVLGSASGTGILAAPVPLPAGIWLLGSVLFGFVVRRRNPQNLQNETVF